MKRQKKINVTVKKIFTASTSIANLYIKCIKCIVKAVKSKAKNARNSFEFNVEHNLLSFFLSNIELYNKFGAIQAILKQNLIPNKMK